MEDVSESIGPGQIHWLASIVEDGTATPDDARGLLTEFVRQVDAGKVCTRMLQHMRDCTAAFLAGKKTLMPAPRAGRQKPVGVPIPSMEKAFGLKRVTAGAPPIDGDTLAQVAMQVLERRLAGESLEEATGAVAEDRKSKGARVSSESQVRDAWASHQSEGLLMLRMCKAVEPDSPAWSEQELRRLNELFWGKVWFCPPGADANETDGNLGRSGLSGPRPRRRERACGCRHCAHRRPVCAEKFEEKTGVT
jgi:hypothetical protein